MGQIIEQAIVLECILQMHITEIHRDIKAVIDKLDKISEYIELYASMDVESHEKLTYKLYQQTRLY